MLKSVHKQSKHQIFILSIIITVIFIVINGSLILINKNSLNQKIEEENLAFTTISSHIIDENPLEVVEEYILHYTHIHEVEVRFTNEMDTILFETMNIDNNAMQQYTIETSQGIFHFYIDNTNSVTVQLNDLNLIIVNSILLIIYVSAMIVFININKSHSNNINKDLDHILSLIDEDDFNDFFEYVEFYHIHNAIKEYLKSIDLLHEQKEMVLKGLAHDVKTPLTILYHYFDKLNKDKPVTKMEFNQAFDAAKKINGYIERMISDQLEHKIKEFNPKPFIVMKLNDYKSILNQKSIHVITDLSEDLSIKFVKQDFERILDNIISNAYYYSKENSVLELKLRADNKAIIEIISEPSNLENLDVKRLFQKGYRANETNNPYGKGLGLYLTKLLIENQQGNISASIEKNYMKITIVL